MDWQEWHEAYADPGSSLSQRRATVQRHVRDRLDHDAAAGRPTRVLSLCAGEGADLLDVLRPGDEVTGRLVELDPELSARARANAPAGIEVLTADAGSTDCAVGAVPADLLLLVGIFGNVVDADIATTVAAVPQLCAPGATVVWSRGRVVDAAPDAWDESRPQLVRDLVAAAGCTEVAYEEPDGLRWRIGVARFDGTPQPLARGQRLFTFVR